MPCVVKVSATRDARPRPSAHWRARAAVGASAFVALAMAWLMSVSGAAAAGQGGSTTGLGGGSAVVSPCGSGITESYTEAYASSIPGYSVSQVNLASIPAACLNKSYKIQLTGAGGAAVGSEMSGTLPAAGTTATIAATGSPDASAVTGISVVIS